MPAPGEVVGDFRIISELGGGGMATVYRVQHTTLETIHALKVLLPEYRANEEARRRFLEEARIQAKYLDHPGIVKVTGIIATAEVAGLVMELVEGESLEDYIRREGASSPEQIRALMLPILHALAHAHDNGIIHRDIKPANVLLERREDRLVPKLTDFGIAKVGDRVAKKLTTQLAARMGTLGYMSPEQIRHAKHVTPRSDVFSLGALLYELATARDAFPGDNEYDVMDAVVHARYRPPQEWVPGIDPAIAAAINTALAADPEARFADARAMSLALAPAGAAAVPAPVPAPTPERSAPWAAIAIAIAALVLVGGGVGVYVATRSSPPAVSDDLLAELGGEETKPRGLVRAPPKTRYVKLSASDWPTQGLADSLLTVIVVIDYDSAKTRELQPTLQRMLRQYGDNARLVIKWRPGTEMGRNAATAAFRALRENSFWAVHDRLLAVPPTTPLTDRHIDEAWTESGLSMLQRLRLGPQTDADERLARDRRELDNARVTVVPSIIVNGEVLGGNQPYDAYKDLFDRQLADAKGHVADGVPADELYFRLMKAIP